MEQWQIIYQALARAGLEVYAPGGHEGICLSPYCVVQPTGGEIPSGSRRCGRAAYRIFLVVPCESPAAMDSLANSASEALSGLVGSGTLQLAAPRSPMMPDDGFQALISYIDYDCYYSERNNA